MRLEEMIFGHEAVEIAPQDGRAVLNLMREQCIIFRTLTKAEKIRFTLSLRDFRRLKAALVQQQIPFDYRHRPGLYDRIYLYRKRLGLVAAALLLTGCLTFSTGFLWKVEVSGCRTVPPEQIRAELAELGCAVGCRLDDLKLDKICNELIKRSSEIAWISINLRGTVARVEVIEQHSPTAAEEAGPANLVAATDGVIERIACYDGKCEIREGQVVREGELLISAFAEDREGAVTLTGASGEVYARTERTFSAFIPYETVQKVHTGREFEEKSINIFGKIVKISKKTGNYSGLYDKIEDIDSWVLFDRIVLPISIKTVRYRGYTTESVLLGEEQALAEAEAVLRQEMSVALKQTDILSSARHVTSAATDPTQPGVTVTYTVSCIENIAAPRPIQISE